MLTAIYIACFVISLYAVLLLFFLSGMARTDEGIVAKEPMHISIVVPFRNEKSVLSDAIANFKEILSHHPGMEVIFVNDHSIDLSKKQLDAMFGQMNISLLHLPDEARGKKAALKYGAEMARDPWILTVDADTRLNQAALEELINKGLDGSSCAVVPVRPKRSKGIAARLFDLEFMVLQAVTVASVRHHMPLMANGAALFLKRESYLKAAALRNDWHISSGDDIFSLFSIARMEGNASVSAFVPSTPLAETDFPSGFAALFRQRMRWIGKTPQVGNVWYAGVAWLVLLANLAFVLVWVLDLMMGNWTMAVIFSAVKWVPEIALMTWGVLYFRRADVLPFIWVGLVLYPLYLVLLVAASTFFTPKWKE